MTVPPPEKLRALPLFHNLTEAELSRLTGQLRYCELPAGRNLVIEEQPGEVVYVVLSGTLKIFVTQLSGAEVILSILGPGDTVGEMSLVDSAGHSASVVTLEKSSLLWLDKATFQDCLNDIPAISRNLVQILVKRLRLANEQIQALATLDVYGRVARQLLAFAHLYGQTTPQGSILIPIRLTQSDIAGLVGASRERINQVMVSYKRQKYISVDRRYRVTILNPAALTERCR